MTTPAVGYVLHTAAPMQEGVQLCTGCNEVLQDETDVDVPPGSTRYDRGRRVLVLVGDDFQIQGPYPEDPRLPKGTRDCTTPSAPTSQGSTP